MQIWSKARDRRGKTKRIKRKQNKTDKTDKKQRKTRQYYLQNGEWAKKKKIQFSPYCFNIALKVLLMLKFALCIQQGGFAGAAIAIAWEICMFSELIRNGELKQVQNI